jgi:hypothetical protein
LAFGDLTLRHRRAQKSPHFQRLGHCPASPKAFGEYHHAAIYAQVYQDGKGKRYVMLTNKGSSAVPVQIAQDGVEVTNQLLETFMTGSNPRAS